MLDLARLSAIRLRPRPLFQRFFGTIFLGPNYNWPLRRTHIVLEGAEHLPKGGAVLLMNHTDRYNYWPFQYALWRRGLGYTATWVKGKYYENRLLGRFMDAANNIPMPSKGYVISRDFMEFHHRAPDRAEYAALRQIADAKGENSTDRLAVPAAVDALLCSPREDAPDYLSSLKARFAAMMARVVEINCEALAMGLYLLIFPEGTRSRRLGRGHTGAAQILLHSGAPAIPIGCSGSDLCYPADSPWSRGGTIVYRIGSEVPLSDLRSAEPFAPFTPEAEGHGARFRLVTDRIMDRINDLVDPPYKYDESALSKAEDDGTRRFL